MRPITSVVVLPFLVITLSSCTESKPPAKAKTHLVKDIIEQAADDSLCPKVTPSLLRAIAKVESDSRADMARFEAHHMKRISATWDGLVYEFENATSHGETQILGRTSRAYGIEPDDVRKNKATAYSLTALILGKDICGRFNGDLTSGIAAYNAGPTWKKKPWKVQKQALLYAAKVMRAMQG